MKLNHYGGLQIYITDEKPGSVPEKNWLRFPREDFDLSLQM